ncbi:hypothetical protein [Brazilian marseillevirus]|uniref:hypothetical protein n=1 Tax=Brazilian marseillevirus TaxID=1813599 RepID=UPI0007847AD4|nr:hypothetical protein A3303_gp435 [Brazilian marseillevirus]AMQ10943.1 hypothetical protein [Brazilian marseillevirus]
MDQDIGLWIDGLQYVWDEKNKRRLYIVPEHFFLVDKDNKVSRFLRGKELFLFPMPKGCFKQLAAVYTGPLNMAEITKMFGKGSLRMEGNVLNKLRPAKHSGTFWIGQHSRTTIPYIFYGKDPKAVKSPIVDVKSWETYENVWDLQKKKHLSKNQVIQIHTDILQRRGNYKYFWQNFSDKAAMELGRQVSFVSFAFFLL